MSDHIFIPPKPVYIVSSASAVGHGEKAGPLGDFFDIADTSGGDLFGEDSFEKAESRMQQLAFDEAVRRCGIAATDVDAVFAGDLTNQCASSCYAGAPYNVPLLGIYGACSTCAEGLLLAAVLASSCARVTAAVTSSHNCSSERQFRFPLEYGAQRPPTAQWTVTGAGAFVISSDADIAQGAANGEAPAKREGDFAVEIADALPGIPRDYGINDANDMGAAMAPAACDTVSRYLRLTSSAPADYDLILTGDLAMRGSELLCDLAAAQGIDLSPSLADCGVMIYDRDAQDKHSGGSGCGCSASVLASHILPKMRRGELREVLFIGTGALMNPQALEQGQNIVGIAHLVHLRAVGRGEGRA